MKKLISVLICLSMTFGMLAGCGSKEAPVTSEPAEEGEPAENPDAEGPAESDGGSLLDEIKSSGTIVVGTSATNAPWESVDENGDYVGYDMDLIREIASRMGVEV